MNCVDLNQNLKKLNKTLAKLSQQVETGRKTGYITESYFKNASDFNTTVLELAYKYDEDIVAKNPDIEQLQIGKHLEELPDIDHIQAIIPLPNDQIIVEGTHPHKKLEEPYINTLFLFSKKGDEYTLDGEVKSEVDTDCIGSFCGNTISPKGDEVLVGGLGTMYAIHQINGKWVLGEPIGEFKGTDDRRAVVETLLSTDNDSEVLIGRNNLLTKGSILSTAIYSEGKITDNQTIAQFDREIAKTIPLSNNQVLVCGKEDILAIIQKEPSGWVTQNIPELDKDEKPLMRSVTALPDGTGFMIAYANGDISILSQNEEKHWTQNTIQNVIQKNISINQSITLPRYQAILLIDGLGNAHYCHKDRKKQWVFSKMQYFYGDGYISELERSADSRVVIGTRIEASSALVSFYRPFPACLLISKLLEKYEAFV